MWALWNWACVTVGLVADFAHTVQWVRENAVKLWPTVDTQLDCSGLFPCTCMCASPLYTLLLHASVSPFFVQICPLSFIVGLGKAIKEVVKLELGLPYLFVIRSHTGCFWMERRLLFVFFLPIHHTFLQNSALITCWTIDSVVVNLSWAGVTQREERRLKLIKNLIVVHCEKFIKSE